MENIIFAIFGTFFIMILFIPFLLKWYEKIMDMTDHKEMKRLQKQIYESLQKIKVRRNDNKNN